jgi:hypothetical protein
MDYPQIALIVLLLLPTAAAGWVLHRKLRIQLRSARARLSSQSKKYADLQDHARTLEAQLHDIRRDLNRTEEERRRATAELDSLRSRLDQLDRERKATLADLQLANVAREQLDQERQQLANSINSLQAEQDSLIAELDFSRARQQQLERERLALLEKLRETEAARDVADQERQHREGTVQGLQADLERLQMQVENAQEEIRRLRQNSKLPAEAGPPVKKDVAQAGKGAEGPPVPPVKPEDRGGGPRGPTLPAPALGEPRGHHPKPEIVCWKRERQWVVGVELPAELLDKSDLEVTQNASVLQRDTWNDDCWQIADPQAEIIVRYGEEEGGTTEQKIALAEDSLFLFKLYGPPLERGRRIKSVSHGVYLAVVPIGWRRDEALSGPAFVEPEPVSLAGYQAHLFSLDREAPGRIAFLGPEDRPIGLRSTHSQFELVGRRLPDASEHAGPLFGGGPPCVRALNADIWRDVQTIVVGQEGRGRNKWRHAFAPSPSGSDLDLPAVVAARRGGWYFLRIYDRDHDLMDSLDFRFLSDLHGITTDAYSALPGPTGHSPVRIEFIHEPGCLARLAKEESRSLEVRRTDNRTSVLIPPDPAWDLTYWDVTPSGGPPLQVELLIERLWWSLGEEAAPHTQTRWSDRGIPTSRESFRATSNIALHLYLPRPGWTDKMLIGFEESSRRAYPAKANDRVVSIPLRDFADSDHVANPSANPTLKVWLERNGIADGGVIVCFIQDQVPPPLPSPPVPGRDPYQMRCCATCDHARAGDRLVGCRRHHWPRVAWETYEQDYARLLCGEWQGEYFDPEGRYHTS